MGIIAYLYNSSAHFYIGTRYNVSFILCIISWCLSIFLAVALSLIALIGPPDYAYDPIG
jgi:ABC-type dipeptide/oligopeptide/nickel transport system permease component